ncbi:neurogenic locus notch homolog protein 1-like [Mya arenaria]|uniref:neurogenic locus notch homolog protein 1-like n=1 Tax=Mya arenaria TaxID=6604 RepID=UPI0022E79EDB|nr:neurogenic locus notch homolog protein 1-like [Mya arenaria]
MEVKLFSILCCFLSYGLLGQAFLLGVVDYLTPHDCSQDEIREHCYDRATHCKKVHDLLGGTIYFCECQPGFRGASCELDSCYDQHCNHGHGSCNLLDKDPYFECKCKPGYSGTHCGASSITTTSTPTVTTTPLKTTTNPPTTQTTTPPKTTTKSNPVYQSCNKYSVVSDLSHGKPVANDNAPNCSSGLHTSNEALVLKNCNVSEPYMWHQGTQVMRDCNSIPSYTAIGTYLYGYYPVSKGLSGVFLECLPNGFKIIFQEHCDKSPEIRHIEEGGAGFFDPNNYYTIA